MLSEGQAWARELSRRAPHERELGKIVIGVPVGRDIRLSQVWKGERLPKGWIGPRRKVTKEGPDEQA